MPGLPVRHQLLEFTQTHVHRAGDAIQTQGPGESLLLQEVFLPEMIFSLPRSLLELTALSHPWLDTKVVPKKCVQTYPQTPSGSRNVRQSWEGEGLLPQEVSLRYQQQGEQGPPPGEGGGSVHRCHPLWTQQEALCLPQGPASGEPGDGS